MCARAGSAAKRWCSARGFHSPRPTPPCASTGCRWKAALRAALAVVTATLGTLGLFCSVMIYVDTRRVFWRFAHTAPRFFGTALILGLASSLVAPGAPRVSDLLLAIATHAQTSVRSSGARSAQRRPGRSRLPARLPCCSRVRFARSTSSASLLRCWAASSFLSWLQLDRTRRCRVVALALSCSAS